MDPRTDPDRHYFIHTPECNEKWRAYLNCVKDSVSNCESVITNLLSSEIRLAYMYIAVTFRTGLPCTCWINAVVSIVKRLPVLGRR